MTVVDDHNDAALKKTWHWLQNRNPAVQSLDLDLDLDLIDNRIVDSLGFMNFILFLEELTGKEIDTTDMASVNALRTLRSIRDNLLSHQTDNREHTDSLLTEDFLVTHGLATLGPRMVEMRSLLESRFLSWASECQASPMLFPALMRVEDLNNFDYFRNFPHLAVVASPLRSEILKDVYAEASSLQTIPSAHVSPGEYVLPSAACYNVYLHLRNTTLTQPMYVTTVATCFRNEVECKGLQRLWGFTMREIVCIGTLDVAQAHLAAFKQRINEFASQLDLPLETQVATDPFYQPQDGRGVMQKLTPVKEEFVYGATVAIASLNIHRNFFGERCSIRTGDGNPAFTSCVAFGLERWLHALLDRFGDPSVAIKELSRVA